MSNSFFNHTNRLVRFDSARAEDLNALLDEVASGLDGVEVKTNAAIKLPDGETAAALPAAGSRAGRVLGFNALTGSLETLTTIGDNKGNWATTTTYGLRDLVKDGGGTLNIYQCIVAHTSGALATDIADGKWTLLVDSASAAAAAAASSSSAGSSSASAAAAAVSETNALNSANIAGGYASFKGVWSSLSGALNIPASVYHNGGFWVLLSNVANVASETPGISAAWINAKSGTDVYTYANRANLRSTTPQTNDQAIVEGLGLFVFEEGSSEPDDDESCFATASGKWLLQAASWDLIDTWQAPDDDARDGFDEDAPAVFASSFASKVLTATFTNAVTSVSANTRTTAVVGVTGATVGDAVFITMSGDYGSNGPGFAFGIVTATNTVTVYLCGGDYTTAYFHAGVWRVTVLKS